MKEYERDIRYAKDCVADGDFEQGDKCFENIFSEMKKMVVDKNTLDYIAEEYELYNKLKKGKLVEILDDADTFAGKGDTISVGEILKTVGDASIKMYKDGYISSSGIRRILFGVKDIRDLSYHIAIPVCLSALEFFYNEKNESEVNFSLAVVRDYSSQVGVDAEVSIANIFSGDRLLGLYDINS